MSDCRRVPFRYGGFCGYHIYNHYAHEAEQTEAFEEIAAIVEQAQTEDSNAPEVPLTEEENVLAEYGGLFLKTRIWSAGFP